ncbi:hypothetical protein AX14_006750 [Amanita brunnescens Koide BX004]|nr:hypothetical protein AX14_006750 [Amanita brunnescens Koide BX004]
MAVHSDLPGRDTTNIQEMRHRKMLTIGNNAMRGDGQEDERRRAGFKQMEGYADAAQKEAKRPRRMGLRKVRNPGKVWKRNVICQI